MKTYTVNEAAEYCCCHPETLREYIRAGKLVASKVGRAYCIRQTKLDEFLAQLENDTVQASLIKRSEQKCQKIQTDCTNATAHGTWTSERQVASALDALLAHKTNKKPKNCVRN
ncbi:helix-turn-helix domain-containing protein [Kingella kingae]|uniref:helix-turn-helix domain-containing protein n=1 Tax=Kingella TaxID=32257 RepID=UPI000BA348D0|nr:MULTISPECIES: helix-turn-helix domain-containing protein [Kingella]MDK4528039.1 helix-turn-helix domain-containing protein [Kingella kingae]MDK4542375.1 helix-turn-helix domain-containing protein [Kingella kingae]MDK4561782.1 helix-turn-helix domain-containing protein [Kingella kingae]MDK4563735.1 helix-turn-helix domain-containing protein [Kingella kingae]MDK4573796.1 helix-turn-helix domain-containing protein [Kingella kingae]